jgi:hypothetical protein
MFNNPEPTRKLPGADTEINRSWLSSYFKFRSIVTGLADIVPHRQQSAPFC